MYEDHDVEATPSSLDDLRAVHDLARDDRSRAAEQLAYADKRLAEAAAAYATALRREARRVDPEPVPVERF